MFTVFDGVCIFQRERSSTTKHDQCYEEPLQIRLTAGVNARFQRLASMVRDEISRHYRCYACFCSNHEPANVVQIVHGCDIREILTRHDQCYEIFTSQVLTMSSW